MTLKYPKQPSSMRTQPNFLLTKLVDAVRVRYLSGDYVDGVWQVPTPVTTTIKINIQPLRGSELMSMPESDRSREWVKVYTTEDIRGIQEGVAALQPDRIIWDGREFEVSKVSTYKMGVLNHTKAIAARVPLSAGE